MEDLTTSCAPLLGFLLEKVPPPPNTYPRSQGHHRLPIDAPPYCPISGQNKTDMHETAEVLCQLHRMQSRLRFCHKRRGHFLVLNKLSIEIHLYCWVNRRPPSGDGAVTL
ncbi:uncharacterized protein LOC120157598 [Hibiscus syriacus]|uniref:uncharacterized protein LOC120157598 n=1 Tax=Hibiscus syriacus TaxID=106335 RepID=UPI001923E61A|nr:uncharacterized protein LOC120157598 [Hibiscus syriacus]